MGWGPAGSGAEEWAKRLRAQDPSFTALCILRFRRYDDEDAKLLMEALAGNHTLLELSSSHRCSPQQAEDLSGALAHNTTLEKLTIGHGEFGDDSLKMLIPGLASSRSLRQLDMSGVPLSHQVAAQLGEALAQGNITSLCLSGKPMMEGSLEALAPGLTKLLHLDLSGCELEASCAASSQPSDSERSCDAAGAALAQVLSVGSLRSLVISHNALGPSFSHRIKSALGAATQLSSLDLSGNGIGSEGCLAICSQLHPQTASSQAGIATGGSALSEGLDSCQLATLNVAGCSIGDAGFVGVCDAIERGAPLRTLDASGAGLSATGLAAGLAKLNAPGNRCRLESLNVSGSHGSFNESSVTALGSLTSIQKLSLFDCALGSDACGISAFVQLLHNGLDRSKPPFQNLTELDLCGNSLELPQLQQLLPLLVQGCLPKLQILVLGANPATDNSEVFAEAAQPLSDARPGLDLMWRAAGGGAS